MLSARELKEIADQLLSRLPDEVTQYRVGLVRASGSVIQLPIDGQMLRMLAAVCSNRLFGAMPTPLTSDEFTATVKEGGNSGLENSTQPHDWFAVVQEQSRVIANLTALLMEVRDVQREPGRRDDSSDAGAPAQSVETGQEADSQGRGNVDGNFS